MRCRAASGPAFRPHGVRRSSNATYIPRPGGRSVRSGVIFDQTPVEEAFQRWREGEFHEVERLAAAGWRAALQELDLVAVGKEMQAIGFSPKGCKTLAEAKLLLCGSQRCVLAVR